MNNIGMKKLLKQVGLVLILTAVYLVVAVPFKVMSVIPGFADIRPVLLLEQDLQNAVFTAHGKKPAQAIVRDRRDRSRGDNHHHAYGRIVVPRGERYPVRKNGHAQRVGVSDRSRDTADDLDAGGAALHTQAFFKEIERTPLTFCG